MRMLTKEEVSFVLHKATEEHEEHPFLRLGQCFFNNLLYYHHDVAESIRASKWDPFYNDELIDECINFITTK